MPHKGYTQTEEHRKKCSDSRMGNKNPMKGKTRQDLADFNKSRTGMKLTDEHKAKIIGKGGRKKYTNCLQCNAEAVYKKHLCGPCFYREHGKAENEKYQEVQARAQKKYRDSHRELVRQRGRKKSEEYKKANISILSEVFGLKCAKCGYDKSFSAMDLHHCDPSEKKNRGELVGKWITTMPADKFRIKVTSVKFMILCANCHRELHYAPA